MLLNMGTAPLTPRLDLTLCDSSVVDWTYRSYFLPEVLTGLEEWHLPEGTRTASPVLGLRPSRALRLRVRKLPKPRNSTLSPCLKASVMHANKMLTMASVCLLVRWTLSATIPVSSDFVTSSTQPKEHVLHGQAWQAFAAAAPAARPEPA